MFEILGLIASPIIALVIGGVINDRKERTRRRHQVFQSLWLTRTDYGSNGRLSPEHVRALNMIVLEFAKDTLDAWIGLSASPAPTSR